MKYITSLAVIVLMTATLATGRYNPKYGQNPTKEDLVNFMKEAAGFVNIYGKKTALKEFSDPNGLFTRGELYIFAYDFKCIVLAHGANPKWVGNDFKQLKDPNGILIIQEMSAIARNSGKGWMKYKWFHPETKKITPKLSYVHKIDNDWWIGSGIYNPENE